MQHWTLPMLLVLSAMLGYANELGLVHMQFPDLSQSLWTAEASPQAALFFRSVGVVLILFCLVLAVFVCAGTIVGDLFTRVPPLSAYAYDLAGSFLGVAAITLAAAVASTPPAWLAIAAVPFLFFSPRVRSFVSFAGILFFGWHSIAGALYSPYYRIDVFPSPDAPGHPIEVAVNRDFHQYMHDLSPRRFRQPNLPADDRLGLINLEAAYDIPFVLTPRRDNALVVGAGTGNDVAAALREHFQHVTSVDIDPLIIEIGQRLHPEHPYSDPRVTRVVNDARAYFQQNAMARFDVVCFGLLDSHAMFSAMSSLRLDNYVYTVESIRSAWKLVKPGGVLTVSFSMYAGPWMSDRLYAIVNDATGVPPIMIQLPMQSANMYVVGKEISLLSVIRRIRFPLLRPTSAVATTRVPSDDWPFLYIRPDTFPWGYVTVIGGLLLIGALASIAVFGRDLRIGGFDVPLFLIGAAFMLIETRGVVDLSLLFGSTWIVNSSVIAGILLMAFLANIYVLRRRPQSLPHYFGLLSLSLLINFFVPTGALLQFSLPTRGALGGLLNALPIFFAGVIFSTLFSRSANPSASFGSNLLGAVVGGCLEYLSMLIGLRSLALLALVLYLAAFLVLQSRAHQSAAMYVSG